MKNLEHLCFDKDGVLIDVHEYWKHTTILRADYLKSFYKLSNAQENKLIDAMGIDYITGKIKKGGPVGYEPRPSILNCVFESLSQMSVVTSIHELENFFIEIDRYQQQNKDYKFSLLKGVYEFLETKKNKYTMTIITSDREKNARITLKKLGIEKFFSEIFGGDSGIKPKPEIDGIEKMCKKVDIPPNKTAYISDTKSDLIMAQKANLLCSIGILTGLGTKKELSKHSNFVYSDFNDLANNL